MGSKETIYARWLFALRRAGHSTDPTSARFGRRSKAVYGSSSARRVQTSGKDATKLTKRRERLYLT